MSSFFRKKNRGSKKDKGDTFDGHGSAGAAPAGVSAAHGESPYGEIPETMRGHDQRSSTSRRRGDFMQKPEDGWKHNDLGMAAGMGVYFTFTVNYVGKIVMPKSISTVSHEAQTDITREAICLVLDSAIPDRPKMKRDLSRDARQYPFDAIRVLNKRVRLSISATGIVLAPVTREDAIIAFYPMKNISLATGGEDLEYDFISFTARDEDTMAREGHVFDCGVDSDAVMEALGQAFSLARELQGKAGQVQSSLRAGYLDVVPDRARAAMAPPPGAEALYADLETIMQQGVDNPSYGMHGPPGVGGARYLDVKPNQGAQSVPHYMDVKPNPPAGGGRAGYMGIKPNPPGGGGGGGASYMDVKPNPPGGGGGGGASYMDVAPDPIGLTLAQQLAAGEALYDQVHGGPIGAKLAEALNQNDMYMDLAVTQQGAGGAAAGAVGADDTYLEFPAWKAYDDAALTNRISVDEIDDAATYDL